MKKWELSRLQELFEAIAAQEPLYIPTDVSGQPTFALWQPGMALTRELNTVRSAKDLFFPQVEELVKFKVEGKKIQVLDPQVQIRDQVVFGVRACDARSFDILDSVFLAEPADTYYRDRRAHTTVMTLACTHPEETCFCTSLGIDPQAPGGDVSCWIEGGALYLNANTPKGQALLSRLPLDEGEKPEADRSVFDRLPLKDLDLTRFGEKKLLDWFHSPKWGELSQSCLGCGTCTFVCPTCQCYDIRDFDTGHGVQRFRCWDSCMYSDFTMMAHGTNRPTQLERFRQRFMHKLVYYPADHGGQVGCVGCGRCLRKCPISMNIVKVARALGEEEV